MDSGTLITLSVVLGIAFFACSQAKDKNGKKYGFKKMLQIWAIAVGVLGAQALYKISVSAEGFEAEISLVPIILILIPFMMIGSNILRRMKQKGHSQPPQTSATSRDP